MMTRYPWVLAVLAVLSLAAMPQACTIAVVTQPNGNGGSVGSGGGEGAGGGAPITADQCNPVTGAGCASDGSACDLDMSGYFQCFPPPNTVDVCGECNGDSLTCGPNLTCIGVSGAGSLSCYRYCCTDGDCGPDSTCDTSLVKSLLQITNPADMVGVCVSSTTSQAPACGPGATSSGGTCVGGYSPTPDGGSPDAGPPEDGGEPDGAPPADGGEQDDGGASQDGGAPDGG
jgi:hypothetical protein